MATLEELVVEIRADTADLKKGLSDVRSGMGKTEKSAKSLNAQFKKFAISAGSLLVLQQVTKGIVNTVVQFENFNASLRTVTGSLSQAEEAMAGLLDFAAKTPFQIEEMVGAFIKLKSLGLDPSEASLRSYGNTALAMGKSLNQMIEAVADASTFEFERLKEFGIRASQSADSVAFTFQGTTTKVGKSAKEIQGFLLDIGQNEFGGAIAERADTLGVSMSNAGDSVAKLALAIGDAGFTELAKTVVGAFTDMTEGATGFVSFFDKFSTQVLEDIKSRFIELKSGISVSPEELETWEKLQESISNIGRKEESPEDAFSLLGIDKIKMEEELEALRLGFLTKEEIELERSEARIEQLKAFLETEYSLTAEQRGLLEQLEGSHADKMQGIKDRKQKDDDKSAAKKHSANASEFRSVLSQAAGQNKILFNINKAAAIAEAVLGARESISQAYDYGVKISGGNPIVGVAVAGIAAAATAANIASIASSSFGGGGGGGSAPSGGSLPEIEDASPTSSSVATTPRQTVNINVDENALVTPAALIALINQGVEDGEQIQINGATV